jgi:uncharacterized membrane protein
MIAFHPPLSGLPLAGMLLLIAVELGRCIARTRIAAEHCRGFVVGATVLATVIVFVSGYQASWGLPALSPELERAVAKHHSIGRFLLLNSLALGTFFFLSRVAIHGRRVLVVLYYMTVASQILLTLWAGSLGGSLVFDHGIGVTTLLARMMH